MTAQQRDECLLRHILSWCNQLEEAHMQYNHSEEAFRSISAYRNLPPVEHPVTVPF